MGVISVAGDSGDSRTFQLFFCDVLLVVEIEKTRVQQRRGRFVGRVVVGFQVRVGQRALDVDPGLGVEGKELLEHVERERVLALEQDREWLLLPERERADVLAGPVGGDGVEVVDRGRAEHVEDDAQLVVVVPAGEERLAGEHLGQDAADGPEVDRFCVRLEEEDLGRAVPPCGDVLGHEVCRGILVVRWRVCGPCQPKVA